MPATVNPTALTWECRYRDGLSGDWSLATLDSLIQPEEVTFALAPQMARATLTRQYGLIRYGDGTTTNTAALDLRGKSLQVKIFNATTHVTWYGICVGSEDVPGATSAMRINPADVADTTVYTGNTTYTCYGMDWLLANRTLDRSLTTAGYVDDVLPFNLSGVRRGMMTGTRSASKVTIGGVGGLSCYVHDPTSTTPWTALNIAEYLLAVFYDLTGVKWQLAEQYTYLNNLLDVWSFDARTSFAEAMNAVISRRYGFSYYADGGLYNLVVGSVLDTAYTVGSLTIPANNGLVDFNTADTTAIRDVSLRHVEGSHYDRIIARGGPIRVCFSMSYDSGNLVAGWSSATESGYAVAADDYRVADAFHAVYRDFVIPDSWDGTDGAGRIIVPVNDQTQNPPVDPTTKQSLWFRDWTFDSFIPYPADAADPDGQTRWRPPFAVCLDRDGKYRYLNAPKWDTLEDVEIAEQPISLSALRDRPGFRLNANPGHLMGLGHFTASSAKSPRWDWQKLVVTAMAATNARLQYEVAAGEASPYPVEQVKVIDVPDAELWLTVRDTYTDINASGAPVKETDGVDYSIKRDDTDTLQTIAAAAAAWYGKRRTKLSVRYADGQLVLTSGGDHQLGHVIRNTYTGGSVEPTGTIISRITYRFTDQGQSSEFETEWGDLDFARLNRTGGGVGGAGHRFGQAVETSAELVRPASMGTGYVGPLTYDPSSGVLTLIFQTWQAWDEINYFPTGFSNTLSLTIPAPTSGATIYCYGPNHDAGAGGSSTPTAIGFSIPSGYGGFSVGQITVDSSGNLVKLVDYSRRLWLPPREPGALFTGIKTLPVTGTQWYFVNGRLVDYVPS